MEAVHVPYKGGGPAMNDVIAGHVAVNMAAIQVAKGLVETGKIKGLAVTSAERSPALPNVPTLKEAGVKTADVDLRFWFGHFRPQGHPGRVKAKLEKAVAATSRTRACASAWPSSTSSRPTRPAPRLKVKLENEITNWSKFIDEQGHQAGMRTRASGRPCSGLRRASSEIAETRFIDAKGINGMSGGYDLIVNGNAPFTSMATGRAAAVGAARRPRAARQPVRLRHRAVRRLHGADRRRAGLLVRARGRDRRRQGHHHRRGARRTARSHPLQQAFLDEQAGQCGYCLSGILISAAALLGAQSAPEPRRDRRGARSASVPLRRAQPRHPRGRSGAPRR